MFQCMADNPWSALGVFLLVAGIVIVALGVVAWLYLRAWDDGDFDEKRRQLQIVNDQLYKR